MTDKNEILELANDCGAEIFRTPNDSAFDVPTRIVFFEPGLRAFTRYMEERHQARIAMLVDAFNNLIIEYNRLFSFTDELDTTCMPNTVFITPVELEITKLKILSATQQSADAFVARMKEEAVAEYKRNRYVALQHSERNYSTPQEEKESK